MYFSNDGFNIILICCGYLCKVEGMVDEGEKSASSVSDAVFTDGCIIGESRGVVFRGEF